MALVIMLVGLTLLFVVIFYVLGASIARFSAGIGSYSAELNERLASIQNLADDLGLASVNLRNLVSRGLSISPTIVFLSFVFWAWLLGGPGAFLALPMTLFVAVILDTFPQTRWLANFVGISSPDAETERPP